MDQRRFLVRPVGDGVHGIFEIDSQRLALDGHAVPPAVDGARSPAAGPAASEFSAQAVPSPGGSGPIIDVLYVYSPAAATVADISAKASADTAFINLAMSNSGVAARVRNAGVRAISSYAETADGEQDLQNLTYLAGEIHSGTTTEPGFALLDQSPPMA